MATEFDTALPSIRQVQTLIKEATVVELKLATGDLLIGRIGWQDRNCLCLLDENEQSTLVWWPAIAYLKRRNTP
jgi:host factor-I protein